MGNKITRRRDTLKGAENDAGAEEPAGECEVSEPQETTETEDLDVVVGEAAVVVARLPSEECTSEMKQAKDPAETQDDAEPQPGPKETPAPVQHQPLVSSNELPTTSEPAKEPKSVTEAVLAPEPKPASSVVTDVEVVPEPISAEALEQQTDMLTPKPGSSSPALGDLGVPDVVLQPVISPPSIEAHGPVDAEKPSDILLTEGCGDVAEAPEIPTTKPGQAEETSGSLKDLEEAAEHLEQPVGDVNEDSVSRLLKNLELQGNDLVADLIASDVKVHDETPNTDMCSSAELM